MTKETINILALVWIGIALVLFPILLEVEQPYGRHISKKWGHLMSNRFGWIIMEVPSLLIIVYFFATSPNIHSRFLVLVFSLWVFHYIHRALIFPFLTHTRGKKIPISIVSMGVFFNLINAGMNGYFMGNYFDGYEKTSLMTFRFGLGLFLFISGMIINIRSDYKLISLRKRARSGYKIPRGWLFEFISCPNYFGEIMEWFGFAIIAWNLPALSFFVWTATNLIPRAIDHHKWYKSHFSNYPQERRAVLPFIL